MIIFSRVRMVGALVVGVTALALTGAPATAATAPAGQASIRTAHFSPDIAGVDVYLTAFTGHSTKLWVSNETYGGVSSYIPVAAGLYTVSMRPHNAPPSQAAMLTWTLSAQAGRAYTAAALGTGSAHKATVLDDDLAAPAAGKARVRLIQAASVAAQATVVAVMGPVLAQNAAFATATGYAQISAGTWPLKAQSDTVPVVSTDGSVSVPAGSVTSILLLDRPGGGLELRSVLDAASAATMPVGAVPAGGGGTATSFTNGAVSDGNRHYARLSELGGSVLAIAMLIAVAASRRRRSVGGPSSLS